ncbi:hypothetical protein NC652_034197 [Populus alba x Populus x berolinensis]|nr:hypothetical protein NC652_034197 [Populus alba x Populus x berolinensis]
MEVKEENENYQTSAVIEITSSPSPDGDYHLTRILCCLKKTITVRWRSWVLGNTWKISTHGQGGNEALTHDSNLYEEVSKWAKTLVSCMLLLLLYIIFLPQTAKLLLACMSSCYCSHQPLLPQTAKRFDSVSFAAFRLRCPGCRNSVAFEFRVIPLEHVYSATCSTSYFLPQTAKRFDSVSFAAFRLRCPVAEIQLPLNFG